MFAVLAAALAGAGLVVVGLVAGAAAGAVVSFSVWLGATSVLLRSLRAREAEDDDVPRAYNLVEGLCATMGLPLPAIWVLDDPALDALALGRGPRTAALVLTTGLSESLDPVALEGVIAHELTHVKNCDIAPATVSAALFLPLAVLVPGLGRAVHALAGRGREFHTDRLAVGVTRYPPGLRDALSAMIEGPLPAPGSALSNRPGARVTRWLWTVALPAPARSPGTTGWTDPQHVVGELDAAAVRIAALDEW